MKTPSDKKRQTETPGARPSATTSETAGRQKNSKNPSTDAQPARPAAATWPFAPGSQGDKTPLEAKPVQRAGWNARQFRI